MRLLKKVKDSYENELSNATIKAAVQICAKICQLYPQILKVQPTITGIHTGMGSWSFNGHGVAISNEEECKGEEIIIEDTSIIDLVENGSQSWYDFKTNKALKDIVELVNYLVDGDSLNCSATQDGFNEKGVVFHYSETANQNNPFSTPNKKYVQNLHFYKQLVKAKVPVVLVDRDQKKYNS